jgi:hypothetical protein
MFIIHKNIKNVFMFEKYCLYLQLSFVRHENYGKY